MRGTAGRAGILIGHEGMAELFARLPRVPLTHQEVKEQMKIRYEKDELQAIRPMGQEGSAAGRIFCDLGLTRNIIALALEGLADSRALQVTLCSILWATRFKTLVDGRLHNTVCRKCGGVDGFQHFLNCANLEIPPRTLNPEPTIAFLIIMARKASEINPGVPEPFFEPTEIVLSLEQEEEADAGEGGEEDSLEGMTSTDEA